MALTRAFLRGMGLTDEQISAIIENHSESMEGIKAARNDLQDKLDRLSGISEENDTLRAQIAEMQKVQQELEAAKATAAEWETKFKASDESFSAYRTEQAAKETRAAKSTAFRKLLETDAKIGGKYLDSIIGVTDFDAIELDKEGKIKGADKLTESIRDQYSAFVTTTETSPAKVETPPTNTGGSAVTKEQFDRMGYSQRLELFQTDRETYDKLKG